MVKIIEPYIDVHLICPLNCVSNKLRHFSSATGRAPLHRIAIFQIWLHWSPTLSYNICSWTNKLKLLLLLLALWPYWP